MRTSERRVGIWRLSLEQIEATVADHLGNGRVRGNQAPSCLVGRFPCIWQERWWMEHDQDRPILQRSPSYDRTARH